MSSDFILIFLFYLLNGAVPWALDHIPICSTVIASLHLYIYVAGLQMGNKLEVPIHAHSPIFPS